MAPAVKCTTEFNAGAEGWREDFYLSANTDLDTASKALQNLAIARAPLLAAGLTIDKGHVQNMNLPNQSLTVDLSGIALAPAGAKGAFNANAGFVYDVALCYGWGTTAGGAQAAKVYYRRSIEIRGIPQNAWTGNPATRVTWTQPFLQLISNYLQALGCTPLVAVPGAGQFLPAPVGAPGTFGLLANIKTAHSPSNVSDVVTDLLDINSQIITMSGAFNCQPGQYVHIYGMQGNLKPLNGRHLLQDGSGDIVAPNFTPNLYINALRTNAVNSSFAKGFVQLESETFVGFGGGGILALRRRSTGKAINVQKGKNKKRIPNE